MSVIFWGVAILIILLFVVGWKWAGQINNYSIVDALWAYGIGLSAVLWLCLGPWSLKHAVAGGMVALWSVRLGWHLHRRIQKHHPQEDSRYQKLREVWEGNVASRFFWFFQAQALSVILLALPFFIIASDRDTTWEVWEALGLTIWAGGLIGEAMADAQMAAFKVKNHSPLGVCREGLWYYSRHPNYFFEGLIWIGFYLFACGAPWGWAMFYAPAVIIYLLLFVTGIPATEAAAVLRKGDAYRRYQQTTSAFIPWFPKRAD